MSNRRRQVGDNDLENCSGGDSGNSGKSTVDGCFVHKNGKTILSGDQVNQGGVVVGTQHLQDGTIDPDRFPWSPADCPDEE